MAHLNHCIHCNETVVNSGEHGSCKNAFFEDLLAQIKLLLETGRLKDLLPELKQTIELRKFRTMVQFLAELKAQKELKELKDRWEKRKTDAYVDFMRDWLEKNPNPDSQPLGTQV